MKRKINLIEAAMKFPQVPIAITVIMVLAGLISLMTMPRSEDPRVTVRQGLVVAFYPGADEEQIEKEVTDKLEQYLFGFEEIKKEKTHSESKPGCSMLICKFFRLKFLIYFENPVEKVFCFLLR